MSLPTPMRVAVSSAQQRSQQLFDMLAAKIAAWREHGQAEADPSTRLFRGIQRRLILWYSGVLAIILLVAGTLLYVGMQEELLGHFNNDLPATAQLLNHEWLEHGGPPCFGPDSHAAFLFTCYAADGSLLGESQQAIYVPAFQTTALATQALVSASGTSQAMIDTGKVLGTVTSYALVVHDPADGRVLGVIQVGYSIQGQLVALATLRTLLLLVALVTLLGSSVGGFLLAQRALAPARLAHSRQQAFIADASHELRTPLTLLRTEAEVLLRGRERLTPADTELVEDIVAETAYLATLTNNLLTLARLDSGTTRIKQDVVDLADIVASVIHRTTTLAAEKHIVVRLSGEGHPTLVLGDQQMLEQAVLILVDNAIKYNVPAGSVIVTVARQNQHAVVNVRDTGVGIAPEHLTHLGERFYRPDQARARETGGTGLGLSIALSIAQAHHGALTLASTPQQGTVATLSIPAVPSSAS